MWIKGHVPKLHVSQIHFFFSPQSFLVHHFSVVVFEMVFIFWWLMRSEPAEKALVRAGLISDDSPAATWRRRHVPFSFSTGEPTGATLITRLHFRFATSVWEPTSHAVFVTGQLHRWGQLVFAGEEVVRRVLEWNFDTSPGCLLIQGKSLITSPVNLLAHLLLSSTAVL